jgi:hypothetical protein
LKNRNESVAVADTGTAPGVSTLTAIATASPGLTGSPTASLPTGTPTGLQVIMMDGITLIDGTQFVDGTQVVDATPEATNTNPGLHLGQTPGTPAAPGQGNPGNTNQPDKPDKTEKPDNPTKAPKEEKPTKAN